MKRVTVSLTDERCVVLTQIAEKQRRTLGNLCSFLLGGSPESVVALTNSESGVVIDADEAGDYASERSFADSGVAVSAPTSPVAAPQCVVTTPAVVDPVPYGDYIPETMSRETFLLMDAIGREFLIRGEMNWPLKPKTV